MSGRADAAINRTPHTTPCVDGPREFADIQEALHYHALANGDACWRGLLSQAAVEIEHLRGLLHTAHLMVAEDAYDAPGRISHAIRPFLAAAVDSASNREPSR